MISVMLLDGWSVMTSVEFISTWLIYGLCKVSALPPHLSTQVHHHAILCLIAGRSGQAQGLTRGSGRGRLPSLATTAVADMGAAKTRPRAEAARAAGRRQDVQGIDSATRSTGRSTEGWGGGGTFSWVEQGSAWRAESARGAKQPACTAEQRAGKVRSAVAVNRRWWAISGELPGPARVRRADTGKFGSTAGREGRRVG